MNAKEKKEACGYRVQEHKSCLNCKHREVWNRCVKNDFSLTRAYESTVCNDWKLSR